MARPNRAQRRAMRLVPPAGSGVVVHDVGPEILPGLPGGETYVSERELEQFAMTMFEAVAAMHPGMEQRKITGERLRLEVVAPRAEAESELIEIHARFDPEKGVTYGR